MKFTFELTKQDYLDFNMFTVKNYKFYKTQMKLFRGIFTIIPIGTGLVNLLLKGEKRIGVIVALLIVMTLISILFWCLEMPKRFCLGKEKTMFWGREPFSLRKIKFKQ